MPAEKRVHNQSCTMTDLAEMAGVSLECFWENLERHHYHKMIDLGWKPYKRKLLPPVRRYLIDEFIKKTNFTDDET